MLPDVEGDRAHVRRAVTDHGAVQPVSRDEDAEDAEQGAAADRPDLPLAERVAAPRRGERDDESEHAGDPDQRRGDKAETGRNDTDGNGENEQQQRPGQQAGNREQAGDQQQPTPGSLRGCCVNGLLPTRRLALASWRLDEQRAV
jgi:hypothetical protein